MKVLDRIEQGLPPVIFGDGSQSYDFIHVADVARANVLALKNDVTDDFFNIGMGVRTTINELVDLLLKITGSTLQPEYRPLGGFSLIEAAMLGKPVVAYDIEWHAELIKNGEKFYSKNSSDLPS